MNHCKVALSNLIASDRVMNSDNTFQAFSDGVLNFFNHYTALMTIHPPVVIMKRYKCILLKSSFSRSTFNTRGEAGPKIMAYKLGEYLKCYYSTYNGPVSPRHNCSS